MKQRKAQGTIKRVYKMPNGMVAVYDEHDQQMPQYQGRWVEKRAEIFTALGTQLHGDEQSYLELKID